MLLPSSTLARAVAAQALTAPQAAVLEPIVGDWPFAASVAQAFTSLEQPESPTGVALLRLHAWLTSAGPVQ